MSTPNCYYAKNQQQTGPITEEQLKDILVKGQLASGDLVFVPPSADWVTVEAYCKSASIQRPAGPPALPARPPLSTAPESELSGVEKQHCGHATWAMISGILGFIMCFPSIIAIVLGHMALNRIDKSKQALTGKGQAIAGLVMGYMLIAMIPVMGMMSAIAVPSFIRARMRAQATTVLNEARQMDAAKDQYALETNKEESSTVTPDFADLTPYLRAGSKLANSEGNDSLGNEFEIGTIQERLRVSAETQAALSAATGGSAFWGPYS